jgi:hypothetical protein
MHRSSESIGAIAAALAQGELTNPEKSLVATIRSQSPGGVDRSFAYGTIRPSPARRGEAHPAGGLKLADQLAERSRSLNPIRCA